MFKLIMFLLGFMAVSAIINMSGSNERVERARIAYERSEKQDAILVDLVAMNNASVNEFVSDWRKAYPEPDAKDVSKLRDLAQRIKNDPASAAKMTVSHHMTDNSFCNGQIQSLVPGPDCKPGL